MVVNVDYSTVIEELAEQLKVLTVNNSILKAQLDAVSKELDKKTNEFDELVRNSAKHEEAQMTREMCDYLNPHVCEENSYE